MAYDMPSAFCQQPADGSAASPDISPVAAMIAEDPCACSRCWVECSAAAEVPAVRELRSRVRLRTPEVRIRLVGYKPQSGNRVAASAWVRDMPTGGRSIESLPSLVVNLKGSIPCRPVARGVTTSPELPVAAARTRRFPNASIARTRSRLSIDESGPVLASISARAEAVTCLVCPFSSPRSSFSYPRNPMVAAWPESCRAMHPQCQPQPCG